MLEKLADELEGARLEGVSANTIKVNSSSFVNACRTLIIRCTD